MIETRSSMYDSWSAAYQEGFLQCLDLIGDTRGIALGFCPSINDLRIVGSETINEILWSDSGLSKEVRQNIGFLPSSIESPSDMVLALMFAMQKGYSLQLHIERKEAFKWMLNKFSYQELRIGGNSGNAANLLASLGFPLVVVHAYPLTREQSALFVSNRNLLMFVRQNNEIVLRHPHEAYEGVGIYCMNWILQYPKGIRVSVDNRVEFVTPRAGKLIATWNPTHSQMPISESFQMDLLNNAHMFRYLFVDGYHLLHEQYADDRGYVEHIRRSTRFVDNLRNMNRALQIHYEFCYIANERIRAAVVQQVLPVVDSIGLNVTELSLVLNTLGKYDLAYKLWTNQSIASVLLGLKTLMTETNVDRVYLHNWGYLLTLLKHGLFEVERIRGAMLFSAVIAATCAMTGTLDVADSVSMGLTAQLDEFGIEQMETLGDHLSVDADFYTTGIAEDVNYDLVFVSTRVVRAPRLMVGIGDVLSSLSFVMGT